MLFIRLRKFPSISSLLNAFIVKTCCILSNAFSAPIKMIMWFLSFILLIWCVPLVDFLMLSIVIFYRAFYIMFFYCVVLNNLNQFPYLIFQAFINTAKEIYEKIQEGVFDINNEVYIYTYINIVG